MKALVSWLDEHFESAFIALMLVAITALSTLQIVMRYCFANALPWVEETVVYMNVWIGFIGCAYAVKYDNNLRIDCGAFLPPRLGVVLKIFADLMTVGVYLYLTYIGLGIVTTVIARGQTSPAAGIPLYLLYSALMVGAALAVLRFVQKSCRAVLAPKNR